MVHDVFVAFLVTLVAVLVIFQVPQGMKADNIRNGFIVAVVFAIIDALSYPILIAIGLPTDLVPFEFFSLIINAALMAIVGFLVPGFKLRWGIWTVVICALALSLIETIIFNVLNLAPTVF